jgi:hemophore-related protein
MIKSAVAVGFLTLSLAGAAVASAQPDTSGIVATTCTYDQVIAALNAQRPDVAADFNSSGLAQHMLRQFLASGPVERQQQAQQLVNNPLAASYIDPVIQIAGVCNQY